MAQKRFKRGKSRIRQLRNSPRDKNSMPSLEMENSIISFLYDSKKSSSMTDIARSISGKRTLRNEFKAAISQLLQDKTISKVDKKRYSLAKTAKLFSGTIELHPKGFGFVTLTKPFNPNCTASLPDRDVHITSARKSNAMHGDTVLVRIIRSNSKGREEGVVLKILEKGADTLAGIFKKHRKGAVVIPDDARFPFTVQVTDYPDDLETGTAVITRLEQNLAGSASINGSIIEILGSPDNIDVQMRFVIEKFHLPHLFSGETLAQAENLDDTISMDDQRTDLREIQHVTIDGETAKDFDDAVCVKRLENSFRLYVSIADVSHFVKPGSPIDKDAYERGTSIYFPGRVIPMLPEKLSNNLCSLVPDEDRLTVTAILDFDLSGRRTKKRFCRSIIRSKKRFTYTTVAQIVVEKNERIRSEHSQFLEMLDNADELARLLEDQRKQRGSIGFSIPEPEIHLDNDGHIESINRAERNFAHQIIEEFMLAANEAVAETFTSKKRKSLYRIHELPDYQKVVEFSQFAKTLDLEIPYPEASPEWFGKVLDATKGTNKEYIVNNLLLRTMQQARYSSDNVGHFALAASDYTHFTSPIRRYPDLMVHRELCRMLREQNKNIRVVSQNQEQNLFDKGVYLSTRERAAINSEREMNDRLKILYMEKHLDEPFEAIISGVSEFAFFVELVDLFISGSVALETFENEYYLFDGKHHRVIGEISGTMYQIGDTLMVTATSVDKNKNRINFKPSLVEN